ncbi:sulfurtransferase TusA family protein [Alkanindiges sp. WGS2144]|uniref:sulfurtransferase TusA family protein n=1 Tax=Alkanindiges sp. WGS2144 TaxID=3366808 RepID=UPI0037502910
MSSSSSSPYRIDATGLHCPMPLLKLKQALHQLPPGTQILLIASDPNSQTDIQRFCQIAGHQVQMQTNNTQGFEFLIQKANS